MKFSIQISTKDRKDDLMRTLKCVSRLISDSVECIVFDDGSTDGTSDLIKEHFPQIIIRRNEVSKGYISCRNLMLNATNAEFVISLDDDSEFLCKSPLSAIEAHFNENPDCGLIAFRIFWGAMPPEIQRSDDYPQRVRGFVGCGHAWRMSAWREIPDYPEWYQFYGEEVFAAMQLFKKQIEVHYLPQVFVHHRVDMKKRGEDKADSVSRFSHSLRNDWNNFLIFYPMGKAVRKIGYSGWTQLNTKVFNGRKELFVPLLKVMKDTVVNVSRIRRNRNPLTDSQYDSFAKLPPAKIFWKP
ncbi:MAG: glycosyltransferase family 2 protein [Flavobacterium sp.]|nr:MAG: glycosyltransferase family 2 protein [Flavobacterium sp.]